MCGRVVSNLRPPLCTSWPARGLSATLRRCPEVFRLSASNLGCISMRLRLHPGLSLHRGPDGQSEGVSEADPRGGGGGGGTLDALEGKGLQRRPQRWLDRRLEEVAKAVGGGYCRLQMPLKLAPAVSGTVAGHRLGVLGINGKMVLEGGGGGRGVTPPRMHMQQCPAVPVRSSL